ncbi:exodeoxyribonuclease VII large subunit [Pseudohalocynthiibacter aestuariivivens]|jgi:exodeoxyribonuclease VII large subunit|uniref:Exodeoxyribonuclease 7 large subunit n=1 Tax=Pseudohalocynthiibacter aestuariivivens TaxID=1591409 RepID=A0ABV5JC49_9RHOB|nr:MULTISPECIES: exodeoxyribonuclease VII large subunit [Pseudohalocynthiibacter]MBS9718420.1 exodeoxyribonuclease VII large subunit [Pseudohalocynthiibacter aestuariivivens]MCK0103429.1 exodeoxyribonuclease VII large subunit [Pseudohalocynthiibacter sp. F2068]
MSDLIDDPAEGLNAPEFTVTEISGAVKRTIESSFSRVRVRGEIGRVSMPRSGHVYLDLKDDRSVLSAVIWKGVAGRLQTQPEEGMEVVATGKLTTFGGQSKYQMVIEDIAPAGMGALMAMLEKRKKTLEAEGLFDPGRKKELPYLPEVIGVITSPSGAVIRDILHRLRDRFPRKVLLWPVAVQGAKCAPEVTRAIEGFNAMMSGGAIPRPDLLIVARGGGSIEDLWGFNEEIVARAAAASDIPLISAVGHETDTTLIDFASDMRAPTPTAAAELAVPVRLELLGWVGEQEARLARALSQSINQRQQRLRDLARALPNPQALVDQASQKFDFTGGRLAPALQKAVQVKRLALEKRAAPLQGATLAQRIRHEDTRLKSMARRLASGLSSNTKTQRRVYDKTAQRLRPLALKQEVDRKKTAFSALSQRLSISALNQTNTWRNRIDALERLHQTLGYKETLKRGYAVVRSQDHIVTSKVEAEKATELEIEFQDGRLATGPSASPKPSRKAKPSPPKPDQGSLF